MITSSCLEEKVQIYNIYFNAYRILYREKQLPVKKEPPPPNLIGWAVHVIQNGYCECMY